MKLRSVMIWTIVFWVAAMNSTMAKEPIRIGVPLSMSGTMSAYGQKAWIGVKLAAKERPKVLDRKVELVLEDDESSSVTAAGVVSELLEKKNIDIIIGPMTSSASLACGPIIERAGTPAIIPWATNPAITPFRKYLFRTCFIDPFQGMVGARFAMEEFKAKSAAVLIDINEDYSVKIGTIFMKKFEEMGGKIVYKALYNRGQQDFSKQIGEIAAADPDIIYCPCFAEEMAYIAIEAKKQGLKQPMIAGDSAESAVLLKAGGKAVEGLFFTSHFDPASVKNKIGKKFVKSFQKSYPDTPITSIEALYYDTYNLVLDAISRAGTTDKEKITAALARTKKFEGVTGTMKMNETHDMIKPVIIMTVNDGKFQWKATVKP